MAERVKLFDSLPVVGSKRKREVSKFYAVRLGKRPGIYTSWDDCQAQIRGFKNASFKAFDKITDAENFIAAKDLALAGAISKVTKWYGVKAGRNPGVYPTWLSVQDEISGFEGAFCKSFNTQAEAEAFVHGGEHSSSTPAPDPTTQGPAKKAKTVKTKSGKDNGSAVVDIADYEPGTAPLPHEIEDGFDNSIILNESTGQIRHRTKEERSKTKVQAAAPAQDSAVSIFTDGSSLGNGQVGAIAGVGVYFGPNDGRNVSEGLAGSRQTNQRAELTAILRALELAPRDRKIIIYSDSNYAINCVTTWFQRWRTNNWQGSSKKPVENKDLVSKIIDLLEKRYEINQHRTYDKSKDPRDGGHWERGPASVKFVWVKGHAANQGNNAADELATSGARQARELHEDIDV